MDASNMTMNSRSGGESSSYSKRLEVREVRSYSTTAVGSDGSSGFSSSSSAPPQQHLVMPPPSPSLSGLMERSNRKNFGHFQQKSSANSEFVGASSSSRVKKTLETYETVGERGFTQNGVEEEIVLGGGGSRLKQHIDELDTLLSDLNNARKIDGPGDPGEDYYSSEFSSRYRRIVDRTAHSGAGTDSSPSLTPIAGGKRSESRNVSPMPSSPFPNRKKVDEGKGYSAMSSSLRQKTTASSLEDYRLSGSATPEMGQRTLVTEKTFYSPSSKGPPLDDPFARRQNPPKRVDDLMTELREFDPNVESEDVVFERETQREASKTGVSDFHLVSPKKTSSSPSPVYYPPGEIFTSTKNERDDGLKLREGEWGSRSVATGASARGAYGYSSGRHERGRSESEGGKQGAAVVPICLPLCCAAPCVIM